MKKATAGRLAVLFLIGAFLSSTLPPPAAAGMIQTGSVAATQARERVADELRRAEVAARLESLGVRTADVRARVNALTDEEVIRLAADFDSLPAGGDAIVGAILLVFLILLVTDIMGLTKVFPFTRSIK